MGWTAAENLSDDLQKVVNHAISRTRAAGRWEGLSAPRSASISPLGFCSKDASGDHAGSSGNAGLKRPEYRPASHRPTNQVGRLSGRGIRTADLLIPR